MSETNNKQIAKNSLFLYLRMVIIMGVTLFTSRVVLQALGVDDYGIYTVVGGITAMFRLMLGSMTDATQRFLTFEIGKGTQGDVNKVFSTSLLLHIIIGVAIVILAEPLGLWFLNHKLIIPAERMTAAFWVFQSSLISMFFLIISIPYNAMIVAYEKMKAFAYISVLDALLRLGIAYLLFVDFGFDKLIVYAILMMASQTFLRFVYNIYCNHNFTESKFHLYYDRHLIIEFGKFGSWTLLGNASYVLSTQGISLLLGTFFAPYVTAARGIALQVHGALTTFVKNFQTAVNPQITKNYAAGNIDELQELVCRSARMSVLLMIIPLFPILMETEFILRLWLGVVPPYTVEFTRLMILTLLLTASINPIEVAAKATGNIKLFEIEVYGSKLLIIPVSYILLKFGYSPVSVFAVELFLNVLALIFSIKETNRLIGLSISKYLHNVIIRVLITCLLSSIPLLIIRCSFEEELIRFVISIATTIPTLIIIICVGLTPSERYSIYKMINRKKVKTENNIQ